MMELFDSCFEDGKKEKESSPKAFRMVFKLVFGRDCVGVCILG